MATRMPSHQLRNGLIVSGRQEHQHKERPPVMASRAVPYTGGDVKKSGELGKMFDIPVLDPGSASSSSSNFTQPPLSKLSRPSSSSNPNSGSVRSNSNSGPFPRKSSGPIPLPATGLITSGPLSGERGRRSGQLEHLGSIGKNVYGAAVTVMSGDSKFEYKMSRWVMWVVAVVIAMGLLVGAFLMASVRSLVFLVVAVGILVVVGAGVVWNLSMGVKGVECWVERYPDAELRGAADGQFVKVTGVVTCGSIPLESTYQRVARCIYASAELVESRGCSGKCTKVKHSEKQVGDFYISDFHTGLRAMVKAGYSAKVYVFVKPTTVASVTKGNLDSSPGFARWLTDRKLSSDAGCLMQLQEGCIKEGSTVSVMGTVKRHDNMLWIVPPPEPVSTGYQWFRCLLPRLIDSIILKCDDNQDSDVIPV
ncbi:hypothetical protein QQ045_009537 [Rhodiola kirilowii]